ncbi:MAG: acetoacetyl-CoA synthase [Gammaproteobacteria bacterium]|nr:MAG: acetoacetyl-CoA synthase [Gammaproteobacteria bacterium]
MSRPADSSPRKQAVNLAIDRKLLQAAREVRINLSATLEDALEAAVRQRRRDLWLDENREAIQAYNRLIEQEGVFSDELGTF